MTTPEWLRVTEDVIEVLEALQVPYAIGGSAASIVHGIARTTFDTDLVADLKPEHVAPFVSALEESFYLDEQQIRESLERKTSFNLIHQNTMFKVDVFIPKDRPFEQLQLARRVQMTIARDPERKAWMASAEDSILAKLEWFRLGGETSERQWRDVLGILKTQAGHLDLAYLRRAAQTLNVEDLLEIAFDEAS